MNHAAMTGPVAGAPARTGLGLFARDAALVLVLFLGMAAVLAFAWVGYLGSDDVTYATGAYGWLRQFPYVGGHGTIRYLITWPIALSFVAFGEGEFQLVLPTICYFAALIAVTYLCMARLLDRATAVVAAILVMTLPLFAVQATTASADITELTFIVASAWLFYIASTAARPFPLLFASGAAAGLAWLTRETAVALLLFYGLSFLAGYRIKRMHYFVMGAGFFAVWGCELAYLYAMTGNPLYRIFISLHHNSTVTRAVDVAGNLFVHQAINPIVMLLVDQEFAVFFSIAIPAIVLLLAKRVLPGPYAEIARLWSLLAITWFLFFAVNSSLLPLNPRYVAPTAYGAAIAVAIFLRWLWLERRSGSRASCFARSSPQISPRSMSRTGTRCSASARWRISSATASLRADRSRHRASRAAIAGMAAEGAAGRRRRSGARPAVFLQPDPGRLSQPPGQARGRTTVPRRGGVGNRVAEPAAAEACRTHPEGAVARSFRPRGADAPLVPSASRRDGLSGSRAVAASTGRRIDKNRPSRYSQGL